VLNTNPDIKRADQFRADGIYVLPETIADLPPIAGILTAGAGNSLSHVQTAGAQPGIPNVAVDRRCCPRCNRPTGGRP